jgi:hypothetical protein
LEKEIQMFVRRASHILVQVVGVLVLMSGIECVGGGGYVSASKARAVGAPSAVRGRWTVRCWRAAPRLVRPASGRTSPGGSSW